MRKRFARVDADSRRTSLIEATARVLADRGTAGASVRAIAAEAGVSPGLVTHHFASVDTLIAQTYAHVAAQVDRALADAVAAAGEDPRARLDAYVRASFAPPIADPALLATWTAFWGLVRSNPGVAAEFALAEVPGNRWEVWEGLQGLGLDLVVQPSDGRRKKMLLADMDVPLADVLAELDRREGVSGLAEKAARPPE